MVPSYVFPRVYAFTYRLCDLSDLFIIFTHLDYIRRGVGQQFMDWGMKKADEMGFDLFLGSTPHGRPLYETNGFRYIEENVIVPVTDDPDEKWKEIEERLGPFTFWLMWRPANGVYEGREMSKPFINRNLYDEVTCSEGGMSQPIAILISHKGGGTLFGVFKAVKISILYSIYYPYVQFYIVSIIYMQCIAQNFKSSLTFPLIKPQL